MPIRELSSASQPRSALTCDVCVIGVGFAGLLAARHLAKAGKRVIALESGIQRFEPSIHNLNAIDDASGRYSGATAGRFRGLGGSSSRWSGGLLPLLPSDTDPRPYLGFAGWPFKLSELNQYREEIERLFCVDRKPFESDLFRDAAHTLHDNADFVVRWMKLSRHGRRNIGLSLRSEVSRQRGLDIWLGATACDFVLSTQAGRIEAVLARNLAGQHMSIAANEFLVAAGTIETTRLVLLLDAVSNGRAFEKCNSLGGYFQDHLLATVGHLSLSNPQLANRKLGYRYIGSTRRHFHLELSPETQAKAQVASAFAQVSLEIPSGSGLAGLKDFADCRQQGFPRWRDIHAVVSAVDPVYIATCLYWRFMFKQFAYAANIKLRLDVCIEQRPDPDNRITLSDQRDALGVPKARLHWSPKPGDEETFRASITRLRRYWIEAGLAAICPIEWTAAALNEYAPIVDDAVDMYHPSGSTRMGTDPGTSVVDPHLRCHHVPNLTLASASTFPVAGSANPTFTIMQVALRAADAILKAGAAG